MADKKLSITAFVKITKNRAKIAKLFERGIDRVILTFNKIPLYDLWKYGETHSVDSGQAAKLTTPESDKPIVHTEDRVPYEARKEPKARSSPGVETTHRYFLFPVGIEKIQTAALKGYRDASVNVLIVPEFEADADPERFKDLTEIKLEGN